MPALLADLNAEGYLEILLQVCESDQWIAVWNALDVRVYNLQEAGLSTRATDLELWMFCQRHEMVLVTANRNRRGADSLQATIERLNRSRSLPVLTLARPKRLRRDRRYAERAAVRLNGGPSRH